MHVWVERLPGDLVLRLRRKGTVWGGRAGGVRFEVEFRFSVVAYLDTRSVLQICELFGKFNVVDEKVLLLWL